MAGHDRKKQVRSANVGRRLLVGMGAGAGVFFAAAAMATAVGTSPRPCAMAERTAKWGSRRASSASVTMGMPSGSTARVRHVPPPRSIGLAAQRAVAAFGVTTSTTKGHRCLARALTAYIGKVKSLSGSTSGYLRWSESKVWMIAAATTTRVNHLLSAIIK